VQQQQLDSGGDRAGAPSLQPPTAPSGMQQPAVQGGGPPLPQQHKQQPPVQVAQRSPHLQPLSSSSTLCSSSS
jgi:hypothetical protein